MAMFMNKNERKQKVYKNRRNPASDNFKSLYRFDTENVEWLAEHFMGECNETRGGALSNTQKMRIFLRYVGDPGFEVGVGEDIGIHQTTASKIIWFVCQKIVEKGNDWIKFPTTEAESNIAKEIWAKKNIIPHAIGAVDCTHVLILKPKQHGDEFVNRKGLTSFNVQVTCDGNEKITSVDCSWPGSVHDSRILKNSRILQVLHENSSGALLLADEGYPISPWIMTPYRNTNSQQQEFFNKKHSSERVIIERVFGQAKRRFPFLQSKIRLKTDRIPSMILACFVLHNVANQLQDDNFGDSDYNEVNLGIQSPFYDGIANSEKRRGELRREAITNYLSNHASNTLGTNNR